MIDALTEDKLLLFHNPTAPIYVKHNNRILQRKLTCFELGMFWGLPIFLEAILSCPSNLPPIPIHITDHLLLSYLDTLPLNPVKRSDEEPFPIPSLPNKVGGTYIESLKQVLPHTWREHSKSHLRAPKNDYAPVNFGLWNWRVKGLFPQVLNTALKSLRTFQLIHA